MRQFLLAAAAVLVVTPGNCAESTNTPATSGIVYVADFELAAANIKTDPAAPPPPPKSPGLLGRVLPPPPGARKDPQDLASSLVDSMSKSLLKELTKAGLTARRLQAGEPLPTAGWLVRGVLTNVCQGNQLERAVVGFGKGKTGVQVFVDIHNLSLGAPPSFHAGTNIVNAHSGRLPGAAPLIERHPASVAARFVMAGGDLDKSIRQVAAQIAGEVVERAKSSDPILAAGARER